MINSLIMIISILLSVAFITLLERKLLSYSQARKGPNLVGVLGLLQPFSDGLKLLLKKEPQWSNSFFISFPPIMFWLSSLIFWIPLNDSGSMMKTSFLWLMVFSSLGGIFTFLTGWNGGSVYSILGGIRASAQMISYEVVLSFFFLMSMGISSSFFLQDFKECSFFTSFFCGWWLLLPFWLLSILAETNRAPFDLTEGESELVSGFNTEYSSISFTLLFLGEYSMILAFSMISSILFFQSWIWGLFFVIFILWIRSCFPRKRYDFLMYLMWMLMFPSIIVMLIMEFLLIL
uniref:NADH-ubiquinone oxidoreductase chain 1 n=1 Tax=Symsagittifera roscoffensis TaxID=84072 RepID=E3UFF0_SYMRO|nr:NADH dehydrogenase subunit 1 [Symsagittifera roscoffensis]ADI75249.1 NADH dehydrogenase subunit 1 [Symsagittifera roscoffensis]